LQIKVLHFIQIQNSITTNHSFPTALPMP
jgi:hypothetical protein